MHRHQPSLAIPNRSGHDLYEAALKGDLKTVRQLIDAGANIHFRNMDRTSLMAACLTGHLDIVKLLVEKQANINEVTAQSWSSLFIAAYNGHTPIVEYLLSKKAAIESVDDYGWTPIVAAAQNGHIDVVKVLLANKADVFQTTHSGLSAHIMARTNEYLDIAEMLGAEEERQRLLFKERLEAPSHLDDAGPNTQSFYGIENNSNTKLTDHHKKQQMDAQMAKQIELANELVWIGAQKGQIATVYLGIDQGGDPQYQGQHPYNCIDAAKHSGNRRCVAFLRSIQLFKHKKVKYWTTDDVLLYIEGTLPLSIPSTHIRECITAYNNEHPYKYRYFDEAAIVEDDHIPNKKNKRLSQSATNQYQHKRKSQLANATIIHTSTEHPYVIVYQDLLDEIESSDSESDSESDDGMEEHAEKNKKTEKIDMMSSTVSLQSTPPIPQKVITTPQTPAEFLSSSSSSSSESEVEEVDKKALQQHRNPRDIVEILDGPINGHVLTSPKFFSIVDSFIMLTSEEKKALQNSALCLRHNNPYPHHIKSMFARYSTQFLSAEHSLDLTSFHEVQIYLQTVRDIIVGAHALSGGINPEQPQPLIPVLILDEPVDPSLDYSEENTGLSPSPNETPSSPAQVITGNTNNFGTGSLPAAMSVQASAAHSLVKHHSLQGQQQEYAKLALRWWNLLEYEYKSCGDISCTRCVLPKLPQQEHHRQRRVSSTISIDTAALLSSPVVPHTTLNIQSNGIPDIHTPSNINSTPQHPNLKPSISNHAPNVPKSPNTIILPITLSTTTTTTRNKSVYFAPNATDLNVLPGTPIPSTPATSVPSSPAPHKTTTTTTTTTTQVVGEISSTYYHSRKPHGLTPLQQHRRLFGFEQAYEHLTLTQQFELQIKQRGTVQQLYVNKNITTNDSSFSVTKPVNGAKNGTLPPTCGFMLKNPQKMHDFRFHLLCDGLFTLPALSAAHRRSLHCCNHHSHGYKVQLTNAQVLLIAPYLLYTSWLLGLHTIILTALLNLRGRLDKYPIPHHFDSSEYIEQQKPLEERQKVEEDRNSDNHDDNDDYELEANTLGLPEASIRYYKYTKQCILKNLGACTPTMIPAIDKNIFQIKSKFFSIPIEALTAQPIDHDTHIDNNGRKLDSYPYTILPIVMPPEILEQMGREMRQDEDQAATEHETAKEELQNLANHRNQLATPSASTLPGATKPRSTAWERLQQAMLKKKHEEEAARLAEERAQYEAEKAQDSLQPRIEELTPPMSHSRLAESNSNSATDTSDPKTLDNSRNLFSRTPSAQSVSLLPPNLIGGDSDDDNNIDDLGVPRPSIARDSSAVSSDGDRESFDARSLSFDEKELLRHVVKLMQSPASRTLSKTHSPSKSTTLIEHSVHHTPPITDAPLTPARPPTVGTPFKRRQSRSFDSFELIDSSRLSTQFELVVNRDENDDTNQHEYLQMGVISGDHATPGTSNTHAPHSDVSGILIDYTAPQHLRHFQQHNTGLLLLGQRILRDIEVLCEGNARQVTLQFAELLGLANYTANSTASDILSTYSTPTLSHLDPKAYAQPNHPVNHFDIGFMSELHNCVERLGLRSYCPDVGSIPDMMKFFSTFSGIFDPESHSALLVTIQVPSSVTITSPPTRSFSQCSPTPSVTPNTSLKAFLQSPRIPQTPTSTNVAQTKDGQQTTTSFIQGSTTTTQTTTTSHDSHIVRVTTTVVDVMEISTTSDDEDENRLQSSRRPSISHDTKQLNDANDPTPVIIAASPETPTSSLASPFFDVTQFFPRPACPAALSVSSYDACGSDDDIDCGDGMNVVVIPSPHPKTQPPTQPPVTPAIPSQPRHHPQAIHTTFPITHTPNTHTTLSQPQNHNETLLFEKTQLLSSPFIRAKAMIFDQLASRTVDPQVRWNPGKHATSSLVLVSDKIDSTLWYMCENHATLAQELDDTRFIQQTQLTDQVHKRTQQPVPLYYMPALPDVSVTTSPASTSVSANWSTNAAITQKGGHQRINNHNNFPSNHRRNNSLSQQDKDKKCEIM